MTYLLLFILGLLIGSFLNVISLRYQADGPLLGRHVTHGRSQCRDCSVSLRWYELVPLFSFIVQGAKCRHCKHSLNWQYPIVELVTGILTAAVPWLLFSWLPAGSFALATGSSIYSFYLVVGLWLLAGYTFITLSAIDFRLGIIPDQCNILLGAIGLIFVCLKQFTTGLFPQDASFLGSYATVLGLPDNAFLGALIALAVALALFGGTIYFSKGRGMGMGDLKLALPVALMLGWPDSLIAFMAAFVVGSLFGLLIALQRKKLFKQTMPFGPFIVIGVYVVMFYGESLTRWYFSLI